MANNNYWQGNFYGRAILQSSAKIGGAKDVFVKLGGSKNELVFPTFGGIIKNPFKGQAKLFAGDLAEYRTNQNGVNPQYFILKTYQVTSASGSIVCIKRDGFKHIPFVGDVLMKAPDVIGGAGKGLTVNSVTATTDSNVDVWRLNLSATVDWAAGDILVEAETNPDSQNANATHRMVVKAINSVCPCDYDFRFPGGVDVTDNAYVEDTATYQVTFALGGTMYTSKMSPMPKCVLDLNTANVNGWFKVNYDNLPAHNLAKLVAAVDELASKP